MTGKAAIGADAEMMMVGAQVFITGLAGCTRATSDPRINRNALANGRALRGFTDAFYDTGNLVTERKRQRAIFGYVEALVGAEGEIAVLQMQIRVAYAAPLDAHQHFSAVRRRTIDHGLAKRLAVSDKRLAAHFCHRSLTFRSRCAANASAKAT